MDGELATTDLRPQIPAGHGWVSGIILQKPLRCLLALVLRGPGPITSGSARRSNDLNPARAVKY